MSLSERLFGRRLRSEEERQQQIGPAAGVPVLGLDALASAAYGPEAALTALIPAGALASLYVTSITGCILLVLFLVFVSYRQTIAAYPDGGGAYTVAKQNLGTVAGLLGASALCTVYVLNVAVATSAGVGAIVSAIPALLPYTLVLCLVILLFLTVLNLRGVRTVGIAFTAPTYAFVACLGIAIAIGIVRALTSHGDPSPAVPPATPTPAATAVGVWLLMRAFASGCTAMTGVEAVSNAVPLFREPRVPRARRTLATIVITLAFLLGGVAWLVRAYHIGAAPPGQAGYQSVLSQMVAAVAGRGVFYYTTMTAVLVVLALSANTSFADFPRVCRLLALDEFLPAEFAHRGRRLVYSQGVVALAIMSGVLLIGFGGVTDRLIPLFAVGAFLAFTMSQVGMVMHWRRRSHEPGARHALLLNTAGSIATFGALIVIVLSKFTEGAWLIVIPGFVMLFMWIRRWHGRMDRVTADNGPLVLTELHRPIAVVPLRSLDRVAREGLHFAASIADDVYAVQVLAEEPGDDDLRHLWPALVEQPARCQGHAPPKLIVIRSPYREFFGPFLRWLRQTTAAYPDRSIAVVVPELAQRRWYHFLVSRRATLLKTLLLLRGGPRLVVVNTPVYAQPH